MSDHLSSLGTAGYMLSSLVGTYEIKPWDGQSQSKVFFKSGDTTLDNPLVAINPSSARVSYMYMYNVHYTTIRKGMGFVE